MRALVVEDNVNVGEAVSRTLERLGYNVTFVNYLERGVYESELKRHALAVVDGLNGDGISVLEDISAERRILRTGNAKLREEAKAAGLEAYRKSVSLKQILRGVQ